MRRLLTLVFLAAVAVPAAAQETPRTPRPPRPPRDSARAYEYFYGPEGVTTRLFRRGRLGLLVDLSPDPARDSIGARVAGVTPGGPADKAGVRTGDVVVRINGTALAGTGEGREGGEEEGGSARPGSQLIELASRLHTGDTVKLELRRDSHPLNITLLAGPSGMEDLVRSFRVEPRGMTRVPFPGGEMSFMMSGTPLSNIELVKINPGLAEYFGTAEGLLVVDAPSDSSLGLRAGDVILSIGGRKPVSPSHALRILGTYEPNERVSFEVMRMKRHITVNGKIPDRGAWRAHRDSFDFDQLLEPGPENLELRKELPDVSFPELRELQDLPRMMLPGMQMPELPRNLITLPPMPVDRVHLTKRVVET